MLKNESMGIDLREGMKVRPFSRRESSWIVGE